MKKTLIRLTLAGMLLINIAALALAQQPIPNKDTINADKAAKPVFYQANEEESSSKSGQTALFIAGGVIVAAGAFFLLRKKKK